MKEKICKKLIIVLVLSPLLICLNCKKCKEGENRENVDVAENVKTTLFQFPEGTRWVFKSNTGDMDTVFLGPQTYSYDNGSCRDTRECCTKKYHQQIVQTLNYVLDADGLSKFTQFYFPDHWIISDGGGSIEFSNSQSFDIKYKSTLIVNALTLTDVESIAPIGSLGTLPDRAYWSLSKGLVRYEYLQSGNTYIVYERQDL